MKEGDSRVERLSYYKYPSGGGEELNSESGHGNEVGWPNLRFILRQNFWDVAMKKKKRQGWGEARGVFLRHSRLRIWCCVTAVAQVAAVG